LIDTKVVKKQIIYILVFIFSPLFLFAQKEDVRIYKELGFNIGQLVTNLLRNELNPSDVGNRNYFLTYKKFIQNDIFVRYGLSLFYRGLRDDDENSISFRSDFRIGYEHHYLFENGWQINTGCDLTITYSNSKIVFFDDPTTQLLTGVVPFMGIQYNLNPRVHLSTEFGLGVFFLKQENLLDTTNFTLMNNSGILSKLQLPQELILSISF